MVDDHGNRYSGSRFWSRAYADLVDNPVMLPYLEELLGDPAWGHAPPRLPDALRTRIRLDHEDISYKPPMRPEQADLGGDLHGSPSNTHITVRLPPSLPTHPSRARALRAAAPPTMVHHHPRPPFDACAWPVRVRASPGAAWRGRLRLLPRHAPPRGLRPTTAHAGRVPQQLGGLALDAAPLGMG